MLFALSALAITTHVSIMLAGFALGLVVTCDRRAEAAGPPAARRSPRASSRRCSSSGSAPRFRSANWASIPSSSGWEWRSAWVRCWRTARAGCSGQPLPLAALAAAQLGVPVAAATLGTESNAARPGGAVGADPRCLGHDRRRPRSPVPCSSGVNAVEAPTTRRRSARAVGVRTDAVGPLERTAQRERRAVADLARDRGDRVESPDRSMSAASASRQPVRNAIGDSPTRSVNRRANIARELPTAAARFATVHGWSGLW